MSYNGYSIRIYETLGVGQGMFFEAWKDNSLMFFASTVEAIEALIDELG